MPKELRLSWSAMQSFLSCQRKYHLAYHERLERKPSAEHRNLMLGSAVHAGVEAALQFVFEADKSQNVWTRDWLTSVSAQAARDYITGNTVQHKVVRDPNSNQILPDHDYYNMLREVELLAVELLRFHIPMLQLGQRYLIPTVDDVLSGEPPTYRGETPAIEWHFAVPLDDNTTLSGYIDTVLWDTEEQDYILLDWKTRGSFPHDTMALIDGQLHLYAAIVNDLAMEQSGTKPITRVVMYQMRTKTPSPASISKRTGLPNTGAQSYDTTWEYWVATLPKGLANKAKHYEAEMRPKMRQNSDYQHPIASVVTDVSSQLALDNARATVASIRAALNSGMPLAAILSSNGCKWCDFMPLCINTLRYGGDARHIIADLYQYKEERITDESHSAEE